MFLFDFMPVTRKMRAPAEYCVNYKGSKLQHKFYADFVIYNKIILEIKATSAIHDQYIAQRLNQ